MFVLLHDEESRVTAMAHSLTEPSVKREQEIFGSFKFLDALKTQPCSEDDLTALRQLVIGSNIIEDVARQEDGRLTCSAVYGHDVAAIPALATPGYVISDEQTVWREAALPRVPGRRFLLIAHNGFVIIAQRYQPPSPIRDDGMTLSQFFFNRSNGRILWFNGDPLSIKPSMLHSGVQLWHQGRYVAIDCGPDQAICVALCAPWQAMLLRHAYPFVIVAMSGAVTGGGVGMILIIWWRRRRSLYVRLQHAIRQDHLVMLYQPIVSIASGDVVGVEALMRWPDQSGGHIDPDDFIPIAETFGLIGDLTCFAIRSVSKQFGDFLRYHRTFTVSINIVASDLYDQLFHETLYTYLESQGISQSQIALELTERRAAQVEAADVVIKQLRRIGYKVYIDDFGTGYSSLNYLSDLSIDAIKLDKSFTSTVGTGAARARLIRPIMDMAHDIGVKVIIEGVETDAQAALFEGYGAWAMQGWLFGKAAPAIEIMRRVEHVIVARS
jgi:sensor c-di-GMP phosphodiesterase-like protein